MNDFEKLQKQIEKRERELETMYDIGTLEDNNYTSYGRQKVYTNKKTKKPVYMTPLAVKDYLGISDKQFTKDLKLEFKELEMQYPTDNVDFCMKEDIEDNKNFYGKVLEIRNKLAVFTI